MDCSITIIKDGRSTIHPLQAAWGNKYDATFKIDQQRVRVVIDHQKRAISGFVQIDDSKIGLPSRELVRNRGDLVASWPPANGLTAIVTLRGAQPQTVRAQAVGDLETQAVTPQAAQYWGIFVNDCDCLLVGPSDTKPTVPRGFRLYGYSSALPAANREYSQCLKTLPLNCRNERKNPVKYFGVFKDLDNCRCQKSAPAVTKPPLPYRMTLYDYYSDETAADAALVACTASLPKSCFPDTTPLIVNGVLNLVVKVAGKVTTIGQQLDFTCQSIGDYLSQGSLTVENSLVVATIQTIPVNKIGGSITVDGVVVTLPELSIEFLSGVITVTWSNLTIPKLGIVDAKLVGQV